MSASPGARPEPSALPGTFLVTGVSSGIGRASALALAAPGRRLLLVARDAMRAQGVAAAARSAGAEADVLVADLSSLRQAHALAATVAAEAGELTVVHAAGVALRRRTLTQEGLETTLAVQYLSRHVLGWELSARLGVGLRGVLAVAGGGARTGPVDLGNLQGERRYSLVGAVRTTSILNDLLGPALGDAMAARAGAGPPGLSWVYGPGQVSGTGFTRDLPTPVRLVGGAVVRLVGVPAERAGGRVASLATSRLPGGLYQKDLHPVDPLRGTSGEDERARAMSACDDLVRRLLPDWSRSEGGDAPSP